MILRTHQDQRLLVTQPDHAAVSGVIMARWTADGFPAHPRRDTILLATREHDAGWAEVDAAPLVDAASGRLLDFVEAPDDVRQGVWPRGVERLSADPYAAALVAQHALHVYRDNRSRPAWRPFFDRMEALRSRYLDAAAPLTLDDLIRDYFFVRMGDLASLFAVNNWPGPRVESGYTIRVDGLRITVSPDPFGGATVPFTIRGRLMPAGPYAAASDAAAAFRSAPHLALDAVALGS